MTIHLHPPKVDEVIARTEVLIARLGRILISWRKFIAIATTLPVSYTHLDVYKRQWQPCSSASLSWENSLQ